MRTRSANPSLHTVLTVEMAAATALALSLQFYKRPLQIALCLQFYKRQLQIALCLQFHKRPLQIALLQIAMTALLLLAGPVPIAPRASHIRLSRVCAHQVVYLTGIPTARDALGGCSTVFDSC